ncbi:cobalt/zinc/iron/cadmium/nickel efflux protein [Geotalea daltonii FRC-32]|uniref:Cobalt/zinc/iron/cadmium/nickel efflux protein n=1 Tax=Geotalea daltonii (strain DSM 22248 / JCM 15807 / FRC-32) TaxID=316067 RepID=B9M0N1_GEODF|nr:cation diffusion facilitator family transporter [Geotalea daltonii]ACM19068.1 cobalt/zinc/iron/cadmium/nickel efflux protein [Geotalea daltonii FRC-32]
MSAEAHLDKSIAGRFKYAIVLTSLTLVAEVAGGIWTNSLALLSDAAHVFLDLFALLLSLGAIRLAAMPVSETRTFGWHRAEVFASFINGVSILLIAFGIMYEAWGRFLHPEEVKSLPMFIIALVGLAMNLLSASALHQHSHDDLNVHSAFLHVIGDAAASVGVIAGGVIMYFTGWYVLDAVVSVGIGFVIFWGSWRVIRESVHILLEGVPRNMSITQVSEAIRTIEGVNSVHHLNVWTICSHILALSAHVDILPDYKDDQTAVLRRIEELLFERYHISHTTLQAECTKCIEGPIIKEMRHRPRAVHSHDHGACSHGHHHH